MEMNDSPGNQSVGGEVNIYNTVLTEEESQIIIIVNSVFLCALVGLFGIVTNVINMVVFCKQGLDSSINITLFALAISDLCSLIIQEWFSVCMNPLFENADIPLVPSDFQHLTAGVPKVIFTRITCLITVYITMERCLCIIFPLHVKQMITPTRTAKTMFVLYMATFLSFAPQYCTSSIGWKFYPKRNKTLLGLVVEDSNAKVTEFIFLNLALVALASFFAVVTFTSILIRKLGQKSAWRMTANSDQDKLKTMSNRDRKTISMVILIASILIFCYSPSVLTLFTTLVEPEFSIMGRYKQLYLSIWTFSFLFETINSSVNIFLYMKMSSKYRETFYDLFPMCRNNQE